MSVTEELHIISFTVEYVYQGLKMELKVSKEKQGKMKQIWKKSWGGINGSLSEYHPLPLPTVFY
jgi:hypothetical protein